MRVVFFLLLAYLVGSFPTSHLVGRAFSVDLRRLGSGNLGGANVYRHLGAGAALLVVGADLAKGFLPTWFFPLWDGSGDPHWALGYGLLAICGHIWSVFTGFRGGKGVATAAGALAALAPLAVLVGFLVWLGLLLITRIVSVASLTAATVVPLVAFVAAAPLPTVAFAVALGGLLWWTHRSNVGRLLRREEFRLPAVAWARPSQRESAMPEGRREGPDAGSEGPDAGKAEEGAGRDA